MNEADSNIKERAMPMNESTTMQHIEAPDRQLTTKEMVGQIYAIQDMMKAVMKRGQDGHYGTIPGCGDKPTLLKAGAEKLAQLFRLAPTLKITQTDYQDWHREICVTCTLTHIDTGRVWGEGVGTCSTLESKYRYRQAPPELTDEPVPREYWKVWKSDPKEAQIILEDAMQDGDTKWGKGKDPDSGNWFISKPAGHKIDNPDPADQWNTVLKIAKKRAFVDATLTVTAASDLFTQDVEDLGLGHMESNEPETLREESTDGFITKEQGAAINEAVKLAGCKGEFQGLLKDMKVKKLSEMLVGDYDNVMTFISQMADRKEVA